MDFLYVKALHIIFVVTWFSGMFYLCRLLIYNREANDKPEPGKTILQQQYKIMIKRLLYGITLPSAILTLIFGVWILILYPSIPLWLYIKMGLVLLLFVYHFSLHVISNQQLRKNFRYSSNQLRIWNEVPTIFFSCHSNAGSSKTRNQFMVWVAWPSSIDICINDCNKNIQKN